MYSLCTDVRPSQDHRILRMQTVRIKPCNTLKKLKYGKSNYIFIKLLAFPRVVAKIVFHPNSISWKVKKANTFWKSACNLHLKLRLSSFKLYKYIKILMTQYTGFPPIREIREHFEDFFQSGKSGKNRGFSAKIREKFFKSGNSFSKPFSNFLIWQKHFIRM